MINPYSAIRPWLFAMDAEKAHEMVLASMTVMSKAGLLKVASGPVVDDPFELMGLKFRNRVGLAAGLDKNAAHIDALAQPGNPKPRMFRLPERKALINRLGFNNLGVETFLSNVQRSRWVNEQGGLIGLNIGKNASTPIEQATNDYVIALRAVYPHAAYITVNISSPNTKNLRQLQSGQEFELLLTTLKKEQTALAKEHKRAAPMLVKIAPDLDDDQIDAIAKTLNRLKIDGVIATNTTLNRSAVEGHPLAQEAGGLSGAPVLQASNAVIKKLRAALPSKYPIVGVGGIMSASDAQSKIAAGADLVQIYTGLIYSGPQLVGEIAHALKGTK
jgi:dihydroorotate dehydrogenase